MKRHGFAMEVKPGRMQEYRCTLGEIWPGLTEYLDKNEIHNFSLWNVDRLIFGYYETSDEAQRSKVEENLEAQRKRDELIRKMEDTFQWISTPGEEMRLMYHNYGIVRESKELIRHRVFVTRLKPGCEEEYKRRHDALIEQRGDIIDQGPESNFSIWSAGGYIFGYCEFDTTMEQEITEEARQATIAWETKMLEIMDWRTNDIDWLIGTYHPGIVRLAWHQ